MIHLLDAFFFTILVAGFGLGISYLVVAFFPASTAATRGRRAEALYENMFLGAAGIIIALLMLVALVF